MLTRTVPFGLSVTANAGVVEPPPGQALGYPRGPDVAGRKMSHLRWVAPAENKLR